MHAQVCSLRELSPADLPEADFWPTTIRILGEHRGVRAQDDVFDKDWRGRRASLLPRSFSEIEVEHRPKLIQLLIQTLTRIVLVFVVRVELDVPANWKETLGINCGVAPFAVLAFVKELGTGSDSGQKESKLRYLRAIASIAASVAGYKTPLLRKTRLGFRPPYR